MLLTSKAIAYNPDNFDGEAGPRSSNLIAAELAQNMFDKGNPLLNGCKC